MENQRNIQSAHFDLVNTYFGIDVGHTYDGIDVTAYVSYTFSALKDMHVDSKKDMHVDLCKHFEPRSGTTKCFKLTFWWYGERFFNKIYLKIKTKHKTVEQSS